MRMIMRGGARAPWVLAAATALALCPLAALADEAKGKLVWIDKQNAALLLECADKGCPTIPNAKTGETYTFLIPPTMKAAADALKEGQALTLVYEVTPEKAYRITAVK